MTNPTGNEGEGSRTAAKEYNESTREFTKNEDVEGKAKEARDAVDGQSGDELKNAEDTGKAKARDEDPQVHRDR